MSWKKSPRATSASSTPPARARDLELTGGGPPWPRIVCARGMSPRAAGRCRSGARPRAARRPRLAVVPTDATIVELRRFDEVELDDLEVGRQVEVARRDDRRQLAPEQKGVRWRGTAEQTVAPAIARHGSSTRRGHRQDGEADVLKSAAD